MWTGCFLKKKIYMDIREHLSQVMAGHAMVMTAKYGDTVSGHYFLPDGILHFYRITIGDIDREVNGSDVNIFIDDNGKKCVSYLKPRMGSADDLQEVRQTWDKYWLDRGPQLAAAALKKMAGDTLKKSDFYNSPFTITGFAALCWYGKLFHLMENGINRADWLESLKRSWSPDMDTCRIADAIQTDLI